MADLGIAIDYVLQFEDSTLSGKVTVDAGGETRYGIAKKDHPELAASLFYTSLGSGAALVIARGIYCRQYASPLCIAEIANQDIANKILSLGVNIGIARASRMLQSALGVAEDGCIGVQTLLALSRAEPVDVLACLKAEASRYYSNLAAEIPEDEIYLAGWLRRANA